MLTAMLHKPVLLSEVTTGLDPQPGDVACDATVGLGGHSLALLEAIGTEGRLVGIDRDGEQLELARERLGAEAPLGARWSLVHGDSADLPALLAAEGIDKLDLFLCDCGLSSLHYDDAARGFSMKRSGPLDMRLDRRSGAPTAADVVNEMDESSLRFLLKALGEEPNARRIARAIVERRAVRPFEETEDLAEVVRACYPPAHRHGRRDPATRAFQAIRMHVGHELDSLARLVRASLEMLSIGGRAAYIAFHSLESRLIKQSLQAAGKPIYLTEDDEIKGRSTRALAISGPIKASEAEIEENPRSRSAIMRVVTKLAPIPANTDWPSYPRLAQ
jgi:16S rRNA (cytosine1402-N4)-methyltransferase